MPDNPTDKKLTFVEWLAKDGYEGDIKWTKKVIKSVANYLIDNGIHDGDCTKQAQTCTLCLLEMWLSEYYKYFKQK